MDRQAVMEAALTRRLRNHSELRQARLVVEPLDNGGIRLAHDGKTTGIWEWRDGAFELLPASATDPVVRMATIHGVVVHLATTFCPVPPEPIGCGGQANKD